MGDVARKGGKKNRKHNRNRATNSKASPSTRRYTIEQRWVVNAKKRVERHNNRVAKRARKLAKRKSHVT